MDFLPLVKLWSKRSLILHFALMNIKIRFKGTHLGFAWIAIEPTLTFILLYVVFTSIRIRMGENFAIYLLTGVFLIHIFTRGTMAGLTSLRGNRAILESIKIRKEFFPVVVTAATSLLLLVNVAVFFALMPFFQFIPPWTIVFLPIVLVYVVILVLGLSYILSIIHVYVPDIHPFWGVVTHALFFLSPIFWYLKDVNGILLTIHSINPIGQIIELGHKVVVFGQVPPFLDWAYTGVIVFGIFFLGYGIFQQFEARTVEDL